jgi:hypothetical protein
MKKLFLIGALTLSALTFANTKELTQEQQQALALYFRWWSVAYTNACGTTNTVFFQSDNPDGSQAFIDELAYAVNSTYETC